MENPGWRKILVPEWAIDPAKLRPKRDVAPQVKEAERLVETGRAGEAASLLEEFLESNPDDYDARLLLGRIYAIELPNVGRARERLIPLTELYREEDAPCLVLGYVEATAGNYERAIELFQQAIDCNTVVAYAESMVGWSYLRLAMQARDQGREPDFDNFLGEAIKHSHKALGDCPKSYLALVIVGGCHLILGQDDKALVYFNDAVKVAPDDPFAWFSKLIVHLRARDSVRTLETVGRIRRCVSITTEIEDSLRKIEDRAKAMLASAESAEGGVLRVDFRPLISALAGPQVELVDAIRNLALGALPDAKEETEKSRAQVRPPWVPATGPLSRKDREILRALKKRIDPDECVVGDSSAILRVFERIHHLNQTAGESPLVLLGETGVGKTFLVTYIMRSSNREKERWESINAQLFAGHDFRIIIGDVIGYAPDCPIPDVPREGRKGKLQRCEGGTIFIDELFDLPREMQTLLLTILDHGYVQQVCDTTKGYQPDVRLIFATNRDPCKELLKETLRPDLWSRISSFTVTVPPLRDRKEDIPLMARQFLGKEKIDFRILLALMRHDWSNGNVRELVHALKKLPKRTNNVDLTCLELPEDITSEVNSMSAREVETRLSKLLLDQLKERGFEPRKGLNQEFMRLLGVEKSKAFALLKQART